MTDNTATVPAATDNVAPTTPSSAPTTTGSTYGVIGLVLSILSIPTGTAPFAIAGIVLGFIGRSKEPAHQSTSNWAIIVGFVSLFGWIIFAMLGLALLVPLLLSGWVDGSWVDGSWGDMSW
jgi:hypothetical protein